MTAANLLLASLLAVAGCDSGTYVLLTLQAGQKPLAGAKRVDLNLSMGGKSASAKYSPGGDISFPTTAALEIAAGEGPLVITANALDGSQAILDQGSVKLDVSRGMRKDATLVFGTFGGVETPDMLPADPCAVCDTNALCTVNNGTASCTCQAGYTGNGMTCTDVDECAGNMAGCNANATCVNTPGSSRCVCNTGYSGDGFMCTQIWQIFVDADTLDLTRYGHVLGARDRLYFSNTTNTAMAQFYRSFSASSTPPLSVGMLTTEPVPVPGATMSCADWGSCGDRSGIFAPQGDTLYYFGTNLQSFSTATTPGAWTGANVADSNAWNSNRKDGSAAAALGGEMFLIGGRQWNGSNYVFYNTVDVYSAFTRTRSAAPYPIQVTGAAATSDGRKIYVFGGRTLVGTQENDTPKSYSYDPGTNMWTALPDMPFQGNRYDPVYAPLYKGRVYLLDTRSFNNNTLQVFNTNTSMWESSVPLPAVPNNAQTTGWVLATVPQPTPALFLVNSWVLAGNVKTVVWKFGL